MTRLVRDCPYIMFQLIHPNKNHVYKPLMFTWEDHTVGPIVNTGVTPEPNCDQDARR
jgi:hypothetical protein